MKHDVNIGYILIDPPVGPFSSEEEILVWIEELKTLPNRPEVKQAIEEAYSYISLKGNKK